MSAVFLLLAVFISVHNSNCVYIMVHYNDGNDIGEINEANRMIGDRDKKESQKELLVVIKKQPIENHRNTLGITFHYKVSSDLVVLSDYLRNSDEVWLSHAPPEGLSEYLISLYKDSCFKPTIYIGCVKQYSENDRRGLKRMLLEGFQLQPWVNLAERRHEKYILEHLIKYLDQLKEEPLINQDDHTISDVDLCTISCGEEGVTHLLTESGKLYRSTSKYHAEVYFIGDGGQDGGNIWIKNSPCMKCAHELIQHYSNYYHLQKPTLNVGRIKVPEETDPAEYKEKMIELWMNGFKIQLWENFNFHYNGGQLNQTDINFIKEVNKEGTRRLLAIQDFFLFKLLHQSDHTIPVYLFHDIHKYGLYEFYQCTI